jgi:hypothetical protein
MVLKGLAKKKEAAGSKDLAAYIQSKIADEKKGF